MNFSIIFALFKATNATYLKYKETNEKDYVLQYVSDHSILDSGWDFHWVSSNIAGVVSQLEKRGTVRDTGCLELLGSFCFISDEVLEAYFPQPEKCPLFIGHLFLMQQLLEAVVPILANSDHAPS